MKRHWLKGWTKPGRNIGSVVLAAGRALEEEMTVRLLAGSLDLAAKYGCQIFIEKKSIISPKNL